MSFIEFLEAISRIADKKALLPYASEVFLLFLLVSR